jgi:hypothetical protein
MTRHGRFVDPWVAVGASWFVRRALILAAVAAASLLFVPRSHSATVQVERVEISAPILPNVLELYKTFPATLDGEKAMAHAASLTYDFLLSDCAADYPAITPPASVTVLTGEQLNANYDAVAQCSYEKHGAKPYWIPKLVGDVDICGTELGAGWRLISEDDLATLADADFQFVQDALAPVAATGQSFWGPFYFGLNVWLRTHDGGLAVGNLAPGVTGSRVSPLGIDASSTTHYEGGLALRCIRRTDLP